MRRHYSVENPAIQANWSSRGFREIGELALFESKLNDSDHQALTKILIEYETLLRVTDEMKDDAPWQAELF